MTTDGRFDESITSWLEATAPSRLPEHVLDATFERTRTSRQQAGWRAVLGRIHIDRSVTALGGAAAVLVMAALAVGFVLNQPDRAEGPGRPAGIFADVGGWIAFGDAQGIWALDPTRPNDPEGLVQLSSEGGTPKAWSPDGSKLLVLRAWGLSVLNADGTETRLTEVPASYRTGGDFTADGSRVVYAADGDISVIDAAGGAPEHLKAGFAPTFSPDGSQIAYFDAGGGDHGQSLRVMNSDGTDVRVLVTLGVGHVRDASVDWSPDGKHLVFVLAPSMGVSVIGIDGSGRMEVSSDKYVEGVDPHWSPDGSLISYNHLFGTKLAIARRDGTPIQEFDYGRSGPWNPGLRAPERAEPSHVPTTPPTEAPDVTELQNGFLAARVAGDGAEQYLNGDDIPLLYATTSGATYERAEFEPVRGIDWPYGLTAFKARLFAEDTVVEQLLFWPDDHDPTALGYVPDGFGTDIAPTTEDGQAVAAPFTAFDGEVTLHVTHPWVSRNGSGSIRLIPEGARPTTDGGERNDWDQLVLMADPVGYGSGCTTGPDPADAEALAESIRSDPELEATAPVTAIARGAKGLMMDVVAVGGGGMCGGSLNGSSEVMRLQAGDRMRLYLFDAPEGSSMRILAIAIVVPDSDFERAVEAGGPIVSVEFHAP